MEMKNRQILPTASDVCVCVCEATDSPVCQTRWIPGPLTVWLIQLLGISGRPRSRRTLSFMLSTHGFSLRFPNGGSYSFTSAGEGGGEKQRFDRKKRKSFAKKC